MSRSPADRRRPGARLSAALAVGLAGVLGGLSWLAGAGGPRGAPAAEAPATEPLPAPPAPAASPSPGVAGPGAAPAEPPDGPGTRAPAPRGTASGTVGRGDAPTGDPAPPALSLAGPCPDDEASDPPPRPSLTAPWNLRVDELYARARSMVQADATSPPARAPEDPRRALVTALREGADLASLDALAAHPGRITGDGFDLAAAAALAQAARAWNRGSPAEALARVDHARRFAPDDGVLALVAALALERLGRPDEALAAFDRAYEALPDDPGVALARGRRLANTPRLGAAAASLAGYVDLVGARRDPGMAALARRIALREARFADAELRTLDGLSLLVDPAGGWSQADIRSLHLDLARALAEAAWLLGTVRRARLTVLVHEDRAALHAATCTPAWTDALYDGTLHLHGEALRDPARRDRSLRHEILHAQVHGLPVNVPRWFDEGLAQRFADERSPATLRSWRTMVDNRTWVPFGSLEASFLVIEAPEDAGLAYHQSLAMVDWLVAKHGRGVVAEAMAFLRNGGDPRSLATAVGGPGFDGPALLRFLDDRLTSP